MSEKVFPPSAPVATAGLDKGRENAREDALSTATGSLDILNYYTWEGIGHASLHIAVLS